MTSRTAPRDPRVYRIGIDVGTNSVGLAAVEVDSDGNPISILSAVSQRHDGGVLEAKTATSRLAASGVARRVRRLRRRRSQRLNTLDRRLQEWCWSPLEDNGDPYLPWRARMRLATETITDHSELRSYLATALRHIARHRGWRNPYVRVASLYQRAEPSAFLAGRLDGPAREQVVGFKQRVEEQTGLVFGDGVTVAELAIAAIEFDQSLPLRMGKTPSHKEREFSFLGGKLMQSDNANEILTYAEIQGLGEELVQELIALVFASESPRGSWVQRVGKDPLDGQTRASSATDAYQRFRIAASLTNVRVADGSGGSRALSGGELGKAFGFLTNLEPGVQPTWGDVAQQLGVPRRALFGAASTDEDGRDRLSGRPLVHVSDQRIRGQRKLVSLRGFWQQASAEERDALVALILDGLRDETTPQGAMAWEFLEQMPEAELAELDNLDLPAGRAAYSVESLRKMTTHMLETGDDLHSTRKALFGVEDGWVPPSEPIGAPIGHPSVDRVLKIAARFISAAESEWGEPQAVLIEHVRDSFLSVASARELDRENARRFQAKLNQREAVQEEVGTAERLRNSDVRRFEAVQRQNSQCLYCGDPISFGTAEMDHIVPRKGPGSTNTRTNLIAVCVPCNRSKSSLPFAVWANRGIRPGVSLDEAVERTKFWVKDAGVNSKTWRTFLSGVRDRLEQTEEDPEIDARSIESVAWMANELRNRIAAHIKGTNSVAGEQKVFVYPGAITSEARKASGIEGRLPLIGGGGKTRLDRRHHAVDAAVQALMDPSVARTLAERINIRVAEQATATQAETWKQYQGATPAAQERYKTWLHQMEQLLGLLSIALHKDEIPVMENLRLRLGNGRAHEDTINPLVRRKVGSAITRTEIDAAASPQLWIALTRCADFDENHGLPDNPERRIKVHGSWFGPEDLIDFFDKPRAALAVRGGWAALGDSIHHARIYRWEQKGKTKYGMLRVFAADLQRHRGEDLFSVVPHPSWISMRVAHPSIGRTDLAEYEYLGWLVAGDELWIPDSPVRNEALGEVTRWRVLGFESFALLNAEPNLLAAEGLPGFLRFADLDDDEELGVNNLVGKRARWGVQTFLSASHPTIIRRDALGRPRWESQARLPVSWRIE